MNIIFLSESLDLVGTLLIAYAALKVHYRVKKEHSIDEKVLSEMNLEMSLGILGMVLITVSYLIKVFGLII